VPGIASPGSLRPQGSLALSAPCFSRDLHGPVSCRARSWGSALRSFPLRREGSDLSVRSCPHAVSSNGRALPRASSLGSRALLPLEVRFTTAERSPQPDRCSLGLRLSRDFLPAATATGFPAPPLAGFASGAVKPGGCPSEYRSQQGRFVSVETTAPLEVPAPRSIPEDSSRRDRGSWFRLEPRVTLLFAVGPIPVVVSLYRSSSGSDVGHFPACSPARAHSA
jgi:hypothetical protein